MHKSKLNSHKSNFKLHESKLNLHKRRLDLHRSLKRWFVTRKCLKRLIVTSKSLKRRYTLQHLLLCLTSCTLKPMKIESQNPIDCAKFAIVWHCAWLSVYYLSYLNPFGPTHLVWRASRTSCTKKQVELFGTKEKWTCTKAWRVGKFCNIYYHS